jgi:hypothetical protein
MIVTFPGQPGHDLVGEFGQPQLEALSEDVGLIHHLRN